VSNNIQTKQKKHNFELKPSENKSPFQRKKAYVE